MVVGWVGGGGGRDWTGVYVPMSREKDFGVQWGWVKMGWVKMGWGKSTVASFGLLGMCGLNFDDAIHGAK